jgi:hypothetical protein
MEGEKNKRGRNDGEIQEKEREFDWDILIIGFVMCVCLFLHENVTRCVI